jgi:hypothetical protein
MPTTSNLSFSSESRPELSKHRDIAAAYLTEADDYLAAGAVELAQAHALIAIGHALTDLAKCGIEVFKA